VLEIKKKKLDKKEELSPQIQIKTKIFRTIPTINNTSGENGPLVTTARRSNIDVTFSCTDCGARAKKSELNTCAECGKLFCNQCYDEHDCEDYEDD